MSDKQHQDNRSRQLNPNNQAFYDSQEKSGNSKGEYFMNRKEILTC